MTKRSLQILIGICLCCLLRFDLKVPTIAFNLWQDDFCENLRKLATLKAVIGLLRASNVASTLIVKILRKTC
jgi:hypothetical protein